MDRDILLQQREGGMYTYTKWQWHALKQRRGSLVFLDCEIYILDSGFQKDTRRAIALSLVGPYNM